MKSTRSITNNLLRELRYGFLARLYLPILLIPLAMITLGLYLNTLQVKENYNFYQTTLEAYRQNGQDVGLALSQEAHASSEQQSNGTQLTVVENSLRYAQDQTVRSLFVTTPRYVATQGLELVASFLLPLVFGIVAAYMASYDHKYRTIKLKAIQHEWVHVLSGKALAVFLTCLFTILLLPLVSQVVGMALFSSISQTIPVDALPRLELPVGNLALQLSVSLQISLVYASLGFLLGIVFKQVITPALILVGYHFFLPSLGMYDPKNLSLVLYDHAFMFYSGFQIVPPKVVPLPMAVLGMLIVMLLSLLLAFQLSTRQSKYVT